jgi:type IX secretion system substrate protein
MKNYQQQVLVFALLGSMLFSITLFAQKNIQSSSPILQNQVMSSEEMVLFDCESSTAQIDLDVNNVRARQLAGGDLWWDGSSGRYIIPKPGNGEPEVAAIFAGGLWMGGFDAGGNLKMAAQTYGRAFGSADYWPGPLNEIGITDTDICANYDRFWETTSGAINTHIADWMDNGVIDGPVPNSVLGWPGASNPDFFSLNGFDLPELHDLAPFFDRNSNGIYEPMAGDYPVINGADQGIWSVFNDVGNIHTQSGGDINYTEVQVLAYAYTSSNPNIDNATFYDYKFISNAIEPIDSAYIGLWIDFDLGCYLDDYIGCDSAQNMAYVYNSDALDGVSSCSDCQGVNTYCEEIPMVGIKIIQGPLSPKVFINGVDGSDGLRNPQLGEMTDTIVELGMTSFMYYNNGGTGAPPGTTDPTTGNPLTFYNLLSGSWIDGTRLTKGGDGYDPTSTDYTNYAFSSPPDDPNGWSMCSENLPDEDRRVVIGSGPFQITPGSVNRLSFAVIYADNVTYPCPSLDPLSQACEDVQNLFDGITSSTDELTEVPANIQFQPNPMTNQAELIFKDLDNKVQQVGIFSIDGRQVQTYKNISGNTLTINRGSLPGGIYFYKLLTDDYKIHSGKFIVQ